MDGVSSPYLITCDESLLAINKPSGLRVLPDGYHPEMEHVRSLLEPQYGRLWVVHRLDKDTSGVLLLARSAQVHRALNLQFDHHAVEKTYHALIDGSPNWEEITITDPLRVNGDRRHRTVVDSQRGKAAVTVCRVLERYDEATLIEAHPKTGRTHQIRAHLAHLGHPILGDLLYGSSSQTKRLPMAIERLALHARALSLTHPQTAQRVYFEAPYPADFERWLEGLRNSAAGR